MLPVPSAMLDGRKISKLGASRRSARSVATDDVEHDDGLSADNLPTIRYEPSQKEIEIHIKEMTGTEDMPKRCFVIKDGARVRLEPDGRKCRTCPRKHDNWDPVWLAVFRRYQQLDQQQQHNNSNTNQPVGVDVDTSTHELVVKQHSNNSNTNQPVGVDVDTSTHELLEKQQYQQQ